MTQEEAREAIIVQWQRLPAWKRKTSQDAAEFAHVMITSRPDLTDFECPLDRFLILRSWLSAEQRSTEPPPGKRRAKVKPPRTRKSPAMGDEGNRLAG